MTSSPPPPSAGPPACDRQIDAPASQRTTPQIDCGSSGPFANANGILSVTPSMNVPAQWPAPRDDHHGRAGADGAQQRGVDVVLMRKDAGGLCRQGRSSDRRQSRQTVVVCRVPGTRRCDIGGGALVFHGWRVWTRPLARALSRRSGRRARHAGFRRQRPCTSNRRSGCCSGWPSGCRTWRTTRVPTTSAGPKTRSPSGTAEPATRCCRWPGRQKASRCYPTCVRRGQRSSRRRSPSRPWR